MEYSSTLCFAGNYSKKKKKNPSIKEPKRRKCSSLYHDISFVCHDTKFKQAKGTMSQPVNLCHNKDYSELKAEKSFRGHDHKVLCRDRT